MIRPGRWRRAAPNPYHAGAHHSPADNGRAGRILRWLGEHLTKNGLDITPPSFRLAGRPRFVWNEQHYFPIDNATLPAGVADAGGADYTKRFVGFDPATWTWLIDTRYVNLHGATSYQIGPTNTVLTITMTIPGQPSARSWQFSMAPYTRPYRP